MSLGFKPLRRSKFEQSASVSAEEEDIERFGRSFGDLFDISRSNTKVAPIRLLPMSNEIAEDLSRRLQAMKGVQDHENLCANFLIAVSGKHFRTLTSIVHKIPDSQHIQTFPDDPLLPKMIQALRSTLGKCFQQIFNRMNE